MFPKRPFRRTIRREIDAKRQSPRTAGRGGIELGLEGAALGADGDLDPAWGDAGTYLIDGIDSPPIAVLSGALAIGPAGEILLGWNRPTPPELAVWRVFASGAPGASTIATGMSASEIRAVAVDGLGRIVVARDTGADGFGVDRFLAPLPGGVVGDNSFGTAGSRFVDVDHPDGRGDEAVVALVVEGGDYYVFADADGSVAEDEHVVVPVRLIGSLRLADGFDSQSSRFWSRRSP